MRRLFIFILFIFTFYRLNAQQQTTSKNVDNNILANYDTFFNSLAFLTNYNAIFLGETHSVHFEPYVKLELIKHLNDRYDIHDVFMEVGHAAAYLFNKFIATGDTNLFVSPHLPYTWAKGNYRDFWMKLYAYNNELPNDKKIKIHGVDFERQEVFKVLLLLKPSDKEVPQSMRETFQHITQYAAIATDNGFDADFVKRLKEIRSEFLNNIETVQQVYAANFPIVNAIINNNGPHTPRAPKRNQTMFATMRETLLSEHIDKFAGFFGAAHTYYSEKSSLPNQVNTLKGFNNKVVNIGSIYFHPQRAGASGSSTFAGFTTASTAKELYDLYLKNGNRIMLLSCEEMPNSSLRKMADYILLADDNN